MSTPLEKVFGNICSQLETVKKSADQYNMLSALVVFLPDGRRFRARTIGYTEPDFLWFNGEEEGTKVPGLFVAHHGSVQFLFELRKSEKETPKRKPGFVDTDKDSQVVVKN